MTTMIPKPHQIEMAEQAVQLLNKHNIAYLASEERTGKTLAAILVAEQLGFENIVVLTKLKAIDGWNTHLENFPHNKNYLVTNYHKACKLANVANTLIILDEAHAYLSAYPKHGTIWKEVKKVCRGNKVLYLSATPYAQGTQLLYGQFAVSSYSPWKNYPNFYSWFKTFGKPYTIEVQGREVNMYDRVKDNDVLFCVSNLFITKTRKELGFEHEPSDKVHYIDLDQVTKEVYNELLEHRIVELKAGTLVCDTTSKLRFALHMLEGGVAKINDNYIILANEEKINWIKQNFGDCSDTVIMYYFIAEKDKLEKAFPKARVLQSTSYAEGVDLSMYRHLIVYSMDYSTSKFTQRRARQANMDRKDPIDVHFLVVKKAISHEVYKTVAVNKKNYVDSLFSGAKL
ncbi:chromatin remodeling complex ATPase-like protein [Caudoviricetes sp.]|nr:chromatin remodeling complex ATPase-like protein [Caudoviricetes sp.]